ncbi:hypothetical protein B0T14DRAFT_571242 [Immersiella caudata]|uniref:Uncharacterized protein n=1 Tax=Immersiella caudata TaxID=314043 RepID=A0AA39TSL1_9PEZI|nr:hypothetical protein B0T14DRAFT_571242 [Immersiella caudata]
MKITFSLGLALSGTLAHGLALPADSSSNTTSPYGPTPLLAERSSDSDLAKRTIQTFQIILIETDVGTIPIAGGGIAELPGCVLEINSCMYGATSGDCINAAELGIRTQGSCEYPSFDGSGLTGSTYTLTNGGTTGTFRIGGGPCAGQSVTRTGLPKNDLEPPVFTFPNCNI